MSDPAWDPRASLSEQRTRRFAEGAGPSASMAASALSRDQRAALIASSQSGRHLAGNPRASLGDGTPRLELRRALDERASEAEGRRP